MKWIGGQTLYNDLRLVSGDFTVYKAVNNGNPTISLGSSATERLEIAANYETGAQGLDNIKFQTFTAGSSTNDGKFQFWVDEEFIFSILDDGINIAASGNISIDFVSTNLGGPCNLVLKIIHSGGGRTITWNDSPDILWPGGTAPTLSSSAGTDIVAFYYDGTSYYGQASVAFA